MKVLIADHLHSCADAILKEKGLDPVRIDKNQNVEDVIDLYDGLLVRSATQVNNALLKKAKNLRIVGRAGVGIDNIDVNAATSMGVVVMNAPLGNSITTAEHTISMLLSLVRSIPMAHISTIAGKWEKKRFVGHEVYGKTIGVIGCGNVGSVLADRARGLKMQPIVYDPFLKDEHAEDLHVKKVSLEELLECSDFITLHTPLNTHTQGLINKERIALMRDGVFLVNCARGALIVEDDVLEALDKGKIAGLALDVYTEEPVKNSPFFSLPNVVCTPHLGASTQEAQEKVSQQIAEQVGNYLISGAVTAAINAPSMTAEEAVIVRPITKMSLFLGRFLSQIVHEIPSAVTIEYSGKMAQSNRDAIASSALCGLLMHAFSDINGINVHSICQKKGIEITQTISSTTTVYEGWLRVTQTHEDGTSVSITGTVFSDKKPRIIQVNHVKLESSFHRHMLYIVNDDTPGFIGSLGGLLGECNINIGSLSLGRKEEKKGAYHAIALFGIDHYPNEDVVKKITQLHGVRLARSLAFS